MGSPCLPLRDPVTPDTMKRYSGINQHTVRISESGKVRRGRDTEGPQRIAAVTSLLLDYVRGWNFSENDKRSYRYAPVVMVLISVSGFITRSTKEGNSFPVSVSNKTRRDFECGILY